jgi:hypothetical protein
MLRIVLDTGASRLIGREEFQKISFTMPKKVMASKRKIFALRKLMMSANDWLLMEGIKMFAITSSNRKKTNPPILDNTVHAGDFGISNWTAVPFKNVF